MTKDEVLQEAYELMKTMTPEQRGDFLKDITSLSLHITLEENLGSNIKDIINKSESKVS